MFGRKIMADDSVQHVAVAEPVQQSRELALEFGVVPDMLFADAEAFFALGKLCDVVFICSQDAQHIDMAMKAMELGYDICLEKPAAVNIEDCVVIRDTANRLGRKVMLTHVQPSFTRTTIDDSIESHLMGFKAEQSRLAGGKVLPIE